MGKKRTDEPAQTEPEHTTVTTDETSQLDTPPPSEETRLVLYRGGHPLIRRSGVVLAPNQPKAVPKEIAEALAGVSDCEIIVGSSDDVSTAA